METEYYLQEDKKTKDTNPCSLANGIYFFPSRWYSETWYFISLFWGSKKKTLLGNEEYLTTALSLFGFKFLETIRQIREC